MAIKFELSATARKGAGKGAARATRREGRVPAVIYGDNKEAVLISIEEKYVARALHSGVLFTAISEIDIDGQKHLTLVRDIQLHPVSDRPTHIDFLRVNDKTMIKVNVPVHFINEEECPGIARGGILNVARHDIEVFSRATKIPDSLTVDLTGLDVGDSISFSAVQVPDGVEPTITDRDFTIASITAPSALRSAEGGDASEDGEEGDAVVDDGIVSDEEHAAAQETEGDK
jgi:large subunit ribosomal protein L25